MSSYHSEVTMRVHHAGVLTHRRRLLCRAILIILPLAVLTVQRMSAAPGTQGEWNTLAYQMPINPIHLALMHTGKVLVVAGSGNDPTNKNLEAAVWDWQAGAIALQPVGYDMFCNGMIVLPDGRPFINSGTLAYDPFHGELRSSVYDPVTNSFTLAQNMAHGRWYPTVTTLGDGRVMTFSGLTETGATNTTVELYTPGSGWSPPYQAAWTPPLYPRMNLLPDGRVFYSGSDRGSRFFTPATQAWSAVVATTNYSGTRTYGSSVLLPLTGADNYRPRVMILGGGNPATATTELIDLSAASPKWQYGPSMSQPRIEMNATILPTGQVLALGGSTNDEDASTASLNADLYDPSSNTFSSAGMNKYPRLYHSGSLLLPDATVALVGGNPQRGTYEGHIEIYSPAYLFNADGSTAARPTISGVSASTLSYGGGFQVQTPDAATIASVVLIRPGAPTHAFDMDQRLVTLSYSTGSGVLNVTAPPNGNIAPPGYYMLFILNSAHVPSLATFISLSSAGGGNQPPTATIMSPATNVTVNAGQSVSFTGNGTDPEGGPLTYAWSFPGGTPTSSAVQSPGNVRYAAPGTFVASFTTTDNGGLTSSAATRTVSVIDFSSVSVSPSSRTITKNANTNYTVGVVGSSPVSLSVSGLPKFASGTFNPSSLAGSTLSTLTVTTNKKVASGSYLLTITGTSGAVTQTTTATLIVQ
jgi:hypothetical protein